MSELKMETERTPEAEQDTWESWGEREERVKKKTSGADKLRTFQTRMFCTDAQESLAVSPTPIHPLLREKAPLYAASSIKADLFLNIQRRTEVYGSGLA